MRGSKERERREDGGDVLKYLDRKLVRVVRSCNFPSRLAGGRMKDGVGKEA